MNDTVARLMALADEYMMQEREGINGYEARQALQDELQKLFTPLSDEQVYEISIEASLQLRDYAFGIRSEKPLSVSRLTEQAHGIGERNKQ